MGAEQKGAPLALDVPQLMRQITGEPRGLEIIVKKTSDCPYREGTEQGDDLSIYSERQLMDKIADYERHLKSQTLKPRDGGEKLKKKVNALKEELTKRKQQHGESKTCFGENRDQPHREDPGEKHACSFGHRLATMPFNTPTFKQTRHQNNMSRECSPRAFDEELGLCKGISRHARQFEKGQSLMGDMALERNGQASNFVKTLSSSQFYNSPREAEKKSKDDKQLDRIAGKRDRVTSVSLHKEKAEKKSSGCSRNSIRQSVNATAKESTLCQRRGSYSGMHMQQGPIGTSLDNAMELSDDEEREESDDTNDGSPDGKTFHQYGLRSNSARNEDFRLTYPSGDAEAVEVLQLDLKHLEPFEFLNDTIIDFYIKYLQRPENLCSQKKANIHFFNTFFFKKLLLEKRKKKRADYHSKLRKWTKGINIFDKSYLLVPVHDCAHWSLAIVCFSMEQLGLKPYILHLDSMREGHVSEEVFHVLKSYLELEWRMHSKDNSHASGSFDLYLGEFSGIRAEVPLQQNAWDCGLFVLYYIECFLRDVDGRFTPSLFKSMFGSDWFRPQKASNLRQHIRLVLEDLKKNNNHEITMEDKD